MGIPGVHIETVHNPIRYTYAQIEQACKVAAALGRGKLILAEAPRRLAAGDRGSGRRSGLARQLAPRASSTASVGPGSGL